MSLPDRLRRITPGNVILYREPRANLPLWPSVYLTDEATPKSFLDTRPRGFYSVVMKLATVIDVNNLRWAQTSQLIPFNPSAVDEATKRSTPGLESAYELAYEAKDCAYDLDYWKAILASTQTESGINYIDDDDDDDDDDWANDPEMLKAKQMGLLDDTFRGPEQTAGYFRPFLSPLEPKSITLPPSNSGLAIPTCKRAFGDPVSPTPTSSSLRTYSDCNRSLPLMKRPYPLSPSEPNEGLSMLSSHQNESTAIFAQLTHGTSITSALSGLNVEPSFHRNVPTSATLNGDIVEENLDESSHFVQVFVGPEVDPASDSDIDPERRRFRLQLLKRHVWNRPYFRDTLSARHYFEPIGENTWELVHPRLVDILPVDFRWAAEFLSDGDFGYRNPNDEEQIAETFAQCIAAWKTAEALGMDDLMDHIVKKIRAVQPWWDLWNVMAFACSIYKSDVSLKAHDDLKELFSEYIAEMFFIYLEDDYLSGSFLDRLKQLPELERDVLAKRVARLEAAPQSRQDGGIMPPEVNDDTTNDPDFYTHPEAF